MKLCCAGVAIMIIAAILIVPLWSVDTIPGVDLSKEFCTITLLGIIAFGFVLLIIGSKTMDQETARELREIDLGLHRELVAAMRERVKEMPVMQ